MKSCPQCKMRYPNDATYCFVEGATLETLPDPRVGTVLAGRYVVEAVLGEGGMATVYRARHKVIDRPVAVKVMNPLLSTDAIVRERFRREAKSAQKLAHPNIIEIYDQGETDDGTAYMVMELLDGESLSAVVQRGPMEVDRAIHVMIQIARGLARAHDLEVIHRDIKPENIFLCRREDGTDLVKLLDFGIARSRQDSRLTTQGELFGTPQYMAPERITGQDSGGASDIYALGVVFFEMLTGELPFSAPDVATFFVKHMNEPPPPVRSVNPKVPPALDDLVTRMLAKSPSGRPVDAHRVHQDLIELEIAAPPEPVHEGKISIAPPATLDSGPLDHLARRVFLLEKMLVRAFGDRAKAPAELRELATEIDRVVRRIVAGKKELFGAEEELEACEFRGRENRARLGFAMDALGVDASRAKEELRTARETEGRARDAANAARDRFLTAHKEAMFWEGRSGFAEPTSDLASAYRALADAVDEWSAIKEDERACAAEVEGAERAANDFDFQIRELRAALAQSETALDEERAGHDERIASLTLEADELDKELADLMTRFTSPLRARPELAALFQELQETDQAA